MALEERDPQANRFRVIRAKKIRRIFVFPQKNLNTIKKVDHYQNEGLLKKFSSKKAQ